MARFITLIYRSHVLKILGLIFLGIIAALIDHAMYTIFGWSFLLTWQLFALIFIIRPTITPLLPTFISIVFDTLGGIIIGYTATLLIILQICALLFQDLFKVLPDTTKSLLMAFILLAITIPDWGLSCLILKEYVALAPALLSRLPCALSFPFFYFIATRTARVIISYEFAKS